MIMRIGNGSKVDEETVEMTNKTAIREQNVKVREAHAKDAVKRERGKYNKRINK